MRRLPLSILLHMECVRVLMSRMNSTFWIVVIFVYYIIATLLPIDKIIGKVYPIFAFALIFMALGVLAMLIF